MRKIFTSVLCLILVCSQASIARAEKYTLQHDGGGFCYQIGMHCFANFTVDENYKNPHDEGLARARFERRKEFVEAWYKKNFPESYKRPNMAIEFGKAIVLSPLIPLVLIADFYWHCCKDHTPTPAERIEIEKSERAYAYAWDQMHAYITLDCAKERSKLRNGI